MTCGFSKLVDFFKLEELPADFEKKERWPDTHSMMYTGGTIRPIIDGKVDKVEAIGFHEGKVYAVGTENHVRAKMNKFKPSCIHLSDEQALIPGMIDPHLHIVPKAVFMAWEDFSPFNGQKLRKNYNLDYLKKAIANAKSKFGNTDTDKWILGTGVDPSLMPFTIVSDGLNQLTSLGTSAIDAMEDKNPVFIMAASGHTAYVNTPALERIYHSLLNVKLRENFPEFEDYNKFVCDQGGLQEADNMKPAFLAIPLTQLHILSLYKNIDSFVDEALSRGVTMMYDAAAIAPTIGILNVYLLFHQNKIRIGYAKVCSSLADVQKLPDYTPMSEFKNNHAGSVKIVSDGSNQGLTGYQNEPYCCEPGKEGAFNFPHDEDKITSDSEFAMMVKTATDKGWPLMIHANGNKAIEFTLEAYKLALEGKSGLTKRHRIEHCSLVDDKTLDRIKSLGISPSFLIGHVGYWGYAFKNAILEDKADLLDICQSALKKDMCITLHSDCFVTPIGPLRLMEQAITRIMEEDPAGNVLNAQEKITPEQALKVVTYNAAWQCHVEKWIGSLEEGKMADYVILGEDPITRADPVGIRDIPILETWVEGRCMYKKD